MKQSLVLILISILHSAFCTVSAQSAYEEIKAIPEKAGGVYYAYPISTSENTAPPKGYTPFYISHYGRHGSRYLIGDGDYEWVINKMKQADEADALTELGKDVLQRLNLVWEEARGRGGELTPLGNRQHHDIADRMYTAFPEVFADGAEITAASTTVMRCAHSMFAFIEGLKEHNPCLAIPRESGNRNMDYLNYHSKESGRVTGHDGAWFQDHKKFVEEKLKPARLIKSLFADDFFVRHYVNPVDLMWGIYWIAVDMQNVETKVSFFDLFTTEELFNIWETQNYNQYAYDSTYPLSEGLPVDNAKNLLRNILEGADNYINNGKRGATLRFGHDGNITPLLALLQMPGCTGYEIDANKISNVWRNYFVSPMASNLQVIFFKNKKNEVIVKFMHNEREAAIPAPTDIYPFYRWEDARATLVKLLETPAREFMPEEYK